MTPLLSFTATLLALVSGARTVLWLLSLASTTLIDQAIAIAGGIGLTLGMYGLSARIGLNHLKPADRTTLNATVYALLALSVYATFDWAKSGYQAQSTRAELSSTINTETQQLLTDAGQLTQSQQNNATAFSDIRHLSKSESVNANVEASISARRDLLADLQRQQNTTAPATSTSAQLLGNARLILWALLALALDWTGLLCARIAATDSKPEQPADPLLEQIRSEINAGQHGNQPAVIRVAEQHQVPVERVRQIFQTLIETGELARSGNRYQIAS